MTRLWLCQLFIFASSILIANSAAVSAVPKLDFLFPAGGQRGTKVKTQCHGTFDWPPQVLAPGVEVQIGDTKGELTISIPDDLATDRVWVRLYNSEGISSATPFLIDGISEHLEEEPNNKIGDANSVNLPAVINGVLSKRGEVDCFALNLEAGDTLVAAIDANTRLGSPMDAILQVASPDGTVLAENHDQVGLDPRIVFTASQSGVHVVRVFAFSSTPNTTIAYQGGANYVYRLMITRGPLISHVSPLSIGDAASPTVRVHGWNIPSNAELPVFSLGPDLLHQEFEAGDKRIIGSAKLGFAYSAEFAGSARIRIHPFPLNNTVGLDRETSIATPFSIVDCIGERKQSNTHKLELKKGQTTVIAVESVSLHSSLVPLIRLIDPQGKVAAEVSERGPAKDAVISHKAAMDGEFELTVRDRFRHGGDRYFYRLTSVLQQADFDLSVDRDNVVVSPDKPAEITVAVSRRAGDDQQVGPIKIAVAELPKGVEATEVVSETSGDSASKVSLTITTDGTDFSGPIRIMGFAEKPDSIRRSAMTPAQFGAHFDFIWLTAIPSKK